MQWIFLSFAILAEVTATLSLKKATEGRNQKTWYSVILIGYVTAFAFISLSLNLGLGLGLAYGIWAAAGVALTAVASKALFKEPLNAVMSGGIGLIIAGVLFIELGASH